MQKAQTKLSRRKFLIAASAGTAAGAAVLVGKDNIESATATDGSRQAGGKGYQATEHVRNYYRTARI